MWFDPMLEEFATSIVVCRPARVQALGCPHATVAASQEAEASLEDNHSPEKVAQWMTDSPPLSAVHGQLHVTPPAAAGQHDVMDVEASPRATLSSADAATPLRSADSTDKILHKTPSLLLPQPTVEAQPKL
jgi:hypothetical protein